MSTLTARVNQGPAMKRCLLRYLIPVVLTALAPCAHAQGAMASATATDASDKHLYAGPIDLATNLWGIRAAGQEWRETIATAASDNIDGASYAWSGFAGSITSVKAYPSLRYGASNRHNDAGVSGMPYQFGANARKVDLTWDFTSSGITGKYNHTLDIFFNATNSTKQAEIRGEIMVITDSSQDARTAGWGARDATPFVIDGETWEVWQATQTSNGHSWHVTQFRRRVNAQSFHHNLQDFFAAAARRRPDIFQDGYFVMMVEAGTEIKTGAGRVVHRTFHVKVS